MSTRFSVSALTNLLKLVIGRGRILLVDDTGPVQKLQVKLSGRETPDLLRSAEYGFTSRPPKDTDCVAVFITGDRSNGIVISTNNQRYRLKLENDGEIAIYDNAGRYVWFKKDDGIVVHDPAKITLDAPLVECTGDFSAPNGNISDQTRSMADDRSDYDMHKHSGGNGGGGLTGLPTVIE